MEADAQREHVPQSHGGWTDRQFQCEVFWISVPRYSAHPETDPVSRMTQVPLRHRVALRRADGVRSIWRGDAGFLCPAPDRRSDLPAGAGDGDAGRYRRVAPCAWLRPAACGAVSRFLATSRASISADRSCRTCRCRPSSLRACPTRWRWLAGADGGAAASAFRSALRSRYVATARCAHSAPASCWQRKACRPSGAAFC